MPARTERDAAAAMPPAVVPIPGIRRHTTDAGCAAGRSRRDGRTGAELNELRLRDGFQSRSQTAFVARRSVLLDNAPTSRAVNQRKRGRERFVRASGVLGCDQTPHGPDLVTEAGFAETIDHRLPLGLPGALEG